MKDFFKDLWENLTTRHDDSFMSYVMLSLLWLLVTMLIGIILGCFLAMINGCFLEKKEGYGKIIAMYFEHSHYTTTLIYNGKTTTPITTYHPDAWKLVVDKDGLTDDVYVSSDEYVKFRVNQRVYLVYSEGRIWKSLFVKQLRS